MEQNYTKISKSTATCADELSEKLLCISSKDVQRPNRCGVIELRPQLYELLCWSVGSCVCLSLRPKQVDLCIFAVFICICVFMFIGWAFLLLYSEALPTFDFIDIFIKFRLYISILAL